MKNLRQLTSKEVIFVGGETSNMYQHTGGLLLLDASDCPDFGFESYRRYVEASIARIPQFHWRLEEVALGLDLPYWVEDENFRIDHHVRRIAVPSPGDRVALGELVGYLYSKHMDRGRALVNLLQLAPDEQVRALLAVRDFAEWLLNGNFICFGQVGIQSTNRHFHYFVTGTMWIKDDIFSINTI